MENPITDVWNGIKGIIKTGITRESGGQVFDSRKLSNKTLKR